MARSAGCVRLLMGKEELRGSQQAAGSVSTSTGREQAGRAEERLGKRPRCGLKPQRGATGSISHLPGMESFTLLFLVHLLSCLQL